MQLPNAHLAVIELAKLRDYCLNPLHPRGRHKAKVFSDALGLTAADADLLANAILLAVREADAVVGLADEYGQRYVVDLDLTLMSKNAQVRTAWIIRTTETDPRLVTCYVL